METRKRLGQLLIEKGRVSPEQIEIALAKQRDTHAKLGRILIDLGAINTRDLLDVLSEQLLVAIAPAARLRLARPPRTALGMVPAEMARSRRILPIFYSAQEKSLTLVTSDPNDTATIEAIKSRNALNRVRLLLAEESLLDELIPQHYGDTSEAPETPAPVDHGTRGRPTILFEPDDRRAHAIGLWLDTQGYLVRRVKDVEGLLETVAKGGQALIVTCDPTRFREAKGALDPKEHRRLRVLPSAADLLEESGGTARGMFDFYVKTLDFFLSLLAQDRSSPYHLHGRQVSQSCRLLASRLGLAPEARDAVVLAGYLYQLGDVLATRSRPAQLVSDKVGPGLVAELWKSFDPPVPVVSILQALPERPKDPDAEPLPVAIVRIVSEYIQLRDGFAGRPKLGAARALTRVLEERGNSFNTQVCDALKELVEKEKKLDALEDSTSSGYQVLLVDKDTVALEVLELRLRKEGFHTRRAGSGEDALAEVQRDRPDLVISEITLPRVDGFELCARLKGAETTQDIPFFFLSARSDGANVTKGLELGADDFLTKPINLDILVSKIKRLQRLTRGSKARPQSTSAVQGSLSELGIFDLLQVLQLGMKTARIDLERDGERCVLYIQHGSVISARLGDLEGEEAFFELCTWQSGTFAVFAGQTTSERNVFESNDFLLMEGMRRADEKRAGV